MNKVKKYLLIGLILIIVFLATWQDFFLSEILGEIFRSPVVLIAPFFLISEYFLQRTKAPEFNKINKVFKWFHILYFIITIIMISYWIVSGNSIEILHENIIIKSFKQILYYSFFWGLFRCFYFLLIKSSCFNIEVDKIFGVIILLYIGIIIWEYKNIPNGFTFFHIEKEYARIRLLTPESSATGSILLLLLSGLALGKRTYFKIIVGITFFLCFIFTSQSRMFLIGIMLAFVFINFKWISKHKIISLVGVVISIAFSWYFIFPWLYYSISTDLENFTSVASRSLFYLTSVKSLFIHPIGTGGLSFYYFIAECNVMVNWIGNNFPDLNFSEVLNLGINDAKGISPASSFADFIVLLGIPGLILFIKLCRILFKASKSNILIQLLVIYFLIINCFVESFENKFTYAIFFSIIAFLEDSKIKYFKETE